VQSSVCAKREQKEHSAETPKSSTARYHSTAADHPQPSSWWGWETWRKPYIRSFASQVKYATDRPTRSAAEQSTCNVTSGTRPNTRMRPMAEEAWRHARSTCARAATDGVLATLHLNLQANMAAPQRPSRYPPLPLKLGLSSKEKCATEGKERRAPSCRATSHRWENTAVAQEGSRKECV